MSAGKVHTEIEVGSFVIAQSDDGKIWLEKIEDDDGIKGMEMSANELEEMLSSYWEDNF